MPGVVHTRKATGGLFDESIEVDLWQQPLAADAVGFESPRKSSTKQALLLGLRLLLCIRF